MTTHTLNGREILAVKVPKPSGWLEISNNIFYYSHNDRSYDTSLPSGQWSILGRKEEVTEEVAKRLGFGSAREADFWFWVNGITDEVLLIKNK